MEGAVAEREAPDVDLDSDVSKGGCGAGEMCRRDRRISRSRRRLLARRAGLHRGVGGSRILSFWLSAHRMSFRNARVLSLHHDAMMLQLLQLRMVEMCLGILRGRS